MTRQSPGWITLVGGITVLPGTRCQIYHRSTDAMPYHVVWNGTPVAGGAHSDLDAAKRAAESYMTHLVELGLTP
jgi:hypothetical protein